MDRLRAAQQSTDKTDKTPLSLSDPGFLSVLSGDPPHMHHPEQAIGTPRAPSAAAQPAPRGRAAARPSATTDEPAPTDRVEAVAQLRRTRDLLAGRLLKEEQRLTVLPPDNPDRLLGEHIWHLDLLEYEAACELLNGLAGLTWDREKVELAVLARHSHDLRPPEHPSFDRNRRQN
jgi:hypothetical protein